MLYLVDSQFFCELARYESDFFFHQCVLRSQRVNGKWPYPPAGEPCLRDRLIVPALGDL